MTHSLIVLVLEKLANVGHEHWETMSVIVVPNSWWVQEN